MTQAQRIAALAEMTTDQLVELASTGFGGEFVVNKSILLATLTKQAGNVSAADNQLALSAE